MSQTVLVVLDDDPTGTQTVRNVPVLTEWSCESLQREFQAEHSCFYILTNSRALKPVEAVSLTREIARNLKSAAGKHPFTICSRSDSTLRGHFPLESDTLNEELGPFDATFLVPFFAAGGRVTIDDVHYVREGNELTPAADTPFARDPDFGYRSSNMKEYVEEKTGGAIKASDVISVSAGMDASSLQALLKNLSGNAHVIVNAATREELDIVIDSIREVTLVGKQFLFRTAAEFVASWISMKTAPLLDRQSLSVSKKAGLIIAGSYVPKTTRQLDQLRRVHGIKTVELDVKTLLTTTGANCLLDATDRVAGHLRDDDDVLLMTSREPFGHDQSGGSLDTGQRISDALVEIVKSLPCIPGWILAKGGITSSDIATKALGIRRSIVAGQLLPGVPVWQTGPETSCPGIPYIIFPGNVGDDMALADAYDKLNRS